MDDMRKNRVRGFTLVELLVVIAIIGILVALLLPAIQVRQRGGPSHRMQEPTKANGFADFEPCRLAQGVSHRRHRVQSLTSRITSPDGQPNGPAKQGLGWAYQILPYLEEGAIRGSTTKAQLQKVIDSAVCLSIATECDVVTFSVEQRPLV